MKIIDYSDNVSLTADTTLITADNTLITADATIMFGDSILKVIPREMVDNVFVMLYNELTFKEFKYAVSTTNERGYMVFSIPNTGIEEGDSFEMTVRKDSFDGYLLYRCKAYATVVEDLENYKLSPANSNGIIIIT